MRSSSSSKPVVAYKLNLHVFLLAPIEPILGLCGVPNGWCSRSASRLAISRWRRRNQTFKFQKFLSIETRTLAHGSDTIYSINLSSISSFPDHSKIKSFIHDANKKIRIEKTSFFVFQQMMNIIKWI